MIGARQPSGLSYSLLLTAAYLTRGRSKHVEDWPHRSNFEGWTVALYVLKSTLSKGYSWLIYAGTNSWLVDFYGQTSFSVTSAFLGDKLFEISPETEKRKIGVGWNIGRCIFSPIFDERKREVHLGLHSKIKIRGVEFLQRDLALSLSLLIVSFPDTLSLLFSPFPIFPFTLSNFLSFSFIFSL